MKREGFIYDKVWKWENLVEAENVSTRRKNKKYGVQLHIARRIKNLVEIQEMMIDGTIRTSDYIHDRRVSGQGKMRDIAKLNFHPNHIYHQAMVLVANERIEKKFIRHTYASRKGYGQTKAALQVKKWLLERKDECIWYAQGDICKYYESIPHELLRDEMERCFKDERFINMFMEPFERFGEEGIPLGIRPSQVGGNLALERADRFAKEVIKVKCYPRYLDDFVIFGKTKGEVKIEMKRMEKFLNDLGFRCHPPKIHRMSEGLDFLGYVFYPNGDMYWRKSDKVMYLKRRSKVSNKRRLRELDAAAWGMLKWGNKNCKKLYEKVTGISFNKTGIKKGERIDENGKKIIDVPLITTPVIIGKEIEVVEWVKGIKTTHGVGRYVLHIVFYGSHHKWITNAAPIKTFIDEMDKQVVTRFMTVVIDKGNMHYDFDYDRTYILSVNGRDIEENEEGIAVYSDTKEEVKFNKEDE